MSLRRDGLAAAVLASGYALVAALYWALLNVPESNVLALTLSAALVVLIVVTAAASTAAAVIIADGGTADVRRRAAAAVGGYAVGLMIFAALWWTTARADAWWEAHSGEMDALILRYAGIARTGALYFAVPWITFLVRWALGLSTIAALVAAAASGRGHPLRRGLQGSVRPVTLAATMAGVVIVTEGLWRVAYWRPRGLPATWVETGFAAIKLGVLYGLAIAVAVLVLAVHRRASRSAAAI